MLKDIEVILKQHDVDFYLVGAVARDIQLSANPQMDAVRKTKDVDLAIMLSSAEQFNKLKEALVRTGNFQTHPKEAVKVFYKTSIEVDLLPFGEIESATRFIRLKNPSFVVHMPGFREAYPFAEVLKISEELTVKVCSIEGIVLLKLISHSDRPERTKDLMDIEHIISVYFKLCNHEIFANHFDLMELYDTKDPDYLRIISSRVIGRKFRELLAGSALKERIMIILEKRRNDIYLAMLSGLKDK